jgi:hypothetical protein
MSDNNNKSMSPRDTPLIEKFLSSSVVATILIALMGQAAVSVLYQVINNEQQAANIKTNEVMISNLKHEIYNLQTPLSVIVVRMEARIATTENDIKRLVENTHSTDTLLSTRIDQMDRVGTRALEATAAALQRVTMTQDRVVTRIEGLDKRVGDFENRTVLQLQGQLDMIRENIKRIDEQLLRTVQSLDATYNMLQDHLRQMAPQQRGRGEIPSKGNSNSTSAKQR